MYTLVVACTDTDKAACRARFTGVQWCVQTAQQWRTPAVWLANKWFNASDEQHLIVIVIGQVVHESLLKYERWRQKRALDPGTPVAFSQLPEEYLYDVRVWNGKWRTVDTCMYAQDDVAIREWSERDNVPFEHWVMTLCPPPSPASAASAGCISVGDEAYYEYQDALISQERSFKFGYDCIVAFRELMSTKTGGSSTVTSASPTRDNARSTFDMIDDDNKARAATIVVGKDAIDTADGKADAYDKQDLWTPPLAFDDNHLFYSKYEHKPRHNGSGGDGSTTLPDNESTTRGLMTDMLVKNGNLFVRLKTDKGKSMIVKVRNVKNYFYLRAEEGHLWENMKVEDRARLVKQWHTWALAWLVNLHLCSANRMRDGTMRNQRDASRKSKRAGEEKEKKIGKTMAIVDDASEKRAILLEENGDGSRTTRKELPDYIQTKLHHAKSHFFEHVELVTDRVDVTGYRGDDCQSFLKVYFEDQNWLNDGVRFFQSPEFQWLSVQHGCPRVYVFEGNVSLDVRFRTDYRVQAATWVTIPNDTMKVLPNVADGMTLSEKKVDYNPTFADVYAVCYRPEEWATCEGKFAPLTELSFDIECAGNPTRFPQPVIVDRKFEKSIRMWQNDFDAAAPRDDMRTAHLMDELTAVYDRWCTINTRLDDSGDINCMGDPVVCICMGVRALLDPAHVQYENASGVKHLQDKFDRLIVISYGPCELMENELTARIERHIVASEAEVLRRFCAVLHEVKPDFITGHNSVNFDAHYLYERAKHFDAHERWFKSKRSACVARYNVIETFSNDKGHTECERIKRAHDTSKVKNVFDDYTPIKFNMGLFRNGKSTYRKKVFKSAAFGESVTHDVSSDFVIHNDTWKIWDRDYKERSNTLNALSAKFLKQYVNDEETGEMREVNLQKVQMPVKMIRDYWRREDAKFHGFTAWYCLQDALLPSELLDNQKIVLSILQMARVTNVLPSDVYTRGQQHRVFCILLQLAQFEYNYLLPTLQNRYSIMSITKDAAATTKKTANGHVDVSWIRDILEVTPEKPAPKEQTTTEKKADTGDTDDDANRDWMRKKLDETQDDAVFEVSAEDVTNLENQMNKTPNKKKLGSLAGWLKKATTSGTAGGDNSKSLYKQQKYAAENRKHVGAKRKRQTKVVDATYSGAFVFEPIKGVHIERIDGGKGTRPRWIVVLDFKSLYPMLMVSRNMSHDTLITTRKMARYGIALADCVRVVIGPPEFPAGELECELIEKYDPQTGETTWSECNAKVAYFVQPHVRDNKEGIMCKLENKMLSERKVAKKKKAKCEDPTTGKSLKGMETDHAIYDKEQLSLKVVGNSGYGFTGVKQGSLPCWPIAAAITGLGQERLQVTQNIAENTYMGVCTAYGDSVTEDTPVLVRYADGSIDYVTIDACSNGEWQNYRDSFHGGEKECSDAIEGLHVWSDAGFTPIERVIRHRTDKELFRVMTARGTVDVTEDHSLLDADANELTPRQAVIGQALLHVKPPMPLKAWADDDAEIPAAFALGYAFCTEGARRADGHVPMSVLNGSRHAMFAFREGYSYARFNVQQSTLCTTSKRAAAGLYHLMCVTGIEGLFPDTCAVTQHTTLMDEKHDNDDMLSNGILSVESLGRTDNHVYDLQTGNHHFGAGIGEMVVHNTDSIMPIIPVKTDEEANLIADDIVDMVNDCMVKPMELENEKMAELSLFLKKKRYIMKLIFRDGTYKHLFQGVEAKRRDSLPFTARIMQRVMDILTGKQDDQMTQFVVQQLKEKKPAWAVKLETLSDDERRALKYIPEYAEIRDKVPLCVKRSQWCAWLDALATGPDTKERERLLRAANYQMTGAQWRKQRLRKLLAGQTTRPIDTTGAAAVATYDARLLALKDKTSLRVFGQRTWRHWRARCLEKPSDGGIHRDAAISMIRSHLQDSVQRRVEYAVAYLMDELMLLCDGKIDPSELIQSKKISKLVYKNEPEHLIVRSKIAARTPGSEPQVGDRVPFMLCYPAVGDDSSNKKKRKRRAKFDNTELVEDPVYALQNNLTWAVAELIERKVMNPVMSIMRYFMDDPEEDIFQPIFGYLRKKVNKGRGIDASFHLFSNRYARCALCGGETPAPPKLPRKSDGTKSPTPPQVCVQCAGDESLRKRQRADAEHAIQRALVAKQRVEHTCNTCIRDNMAPLNNLHECENTGCPVWINRIKVFKEHHQTTNHESLMREACKVNALEW